jgi:hypothetical protein
MLARLATHYNRNRLADCGEMLFYCEAFFAQPASMLLHQVSLRSAGSELGMSVARAGIVFYDS